MELQQQEWTRNDLFDAMREVVLDAMSNLGARKAAKADGRAAIQAKRPNYEPLHYDLQIEFVESQFWLARAWSRIFSWVKGLFRKQPGSGAKAKTYIRLELPELIQGETPQEAAQRLGGKRVGRPCYLCPPTWP